MKKLVLIGAVIALTCGAAEKDEAWLLQTNLLAKGTAAASLTSVRDRLRDAVKRLAKTTKVPFGRQNELSVMLPSAPGGYYGLWPDDWYFPNRLVPELLPKNEAHKLFVFLTEAVEKAPVLPDRVEPNGHLVFQPAEERFAAAEAALEDEVTGPSAPPMRWQRCTTPIRTRRYICLKRCSPRLRRVTTPSGRVPTDGVSARASS